GRKEGKLVVNPSQSSLAESGGWKSGGGLDLLFAANRHRVLMIEMGGGPVPEAELRVALRLAEKSV
ncbi:unnamed protein product, partial [Discosporangium mesarthrocarpum]